MSITGSQCRAARGLIGMDQNTLAEAASVARGTLIDFEKGKRTPGANNIDAIARALEAAGVEFTNGKQPGVRMKAAKD
jgi:transcriptional regulator with XRE-family HTH domain